MNEALHTEALNGFEIHELENMYLDYLSQYSIHLSSHITRFSEELIERAPTYEIIKNKETRVFRKECVHEMFSTFLQSSRNWIESVRRVIQPIREDIFKRKNTFKGNLTDKNQDEHLSPFLLSLVSMLIDGEVNSEGNCSQAALTVAGLVTFNSRTLKKTQSRSLSHRRRHHKKERETSVSIYVGLKIYSMVRSRTLVQYLFELGICISYDRILSITKSLYDTLQKSYAEHGIFSLTHLRKGCFVVLVKDNIDKNATANLVSSHFHGTGISLLHLEYENQGERLTTIDFSDSSHQSKKLAPLPAEYSKPSKIYCSEEDYYAPLCNYNFVDLTEYTDLEREKVAEQKWLNQFVSPNDHAKSWAQYHIKEKSIEPPMVEDTNSLLPLL